ncbi:hypothetical protein PR202_ga30300 [Eleusine coracana subsp. coracana]|uniref:F-box domain-containing protein n=1 Tax=Eleusine coracana subsp. coracana TaxID=191504 RepID=A0AAV5DPB8_ELECO|nr:hypothetical protein PR202_ga30300 [Eleusine coracana subsp. coracana]
MAGSRRRRQLKKQREQAAAIIRVNFVERLPQELLAKIHDHLRFLDRLAFAVVCKTAGHPVPQQLDDTEPWLVFPDETKEEATFFSLAKGRAASARTSDLGTRGHVVLGSSSGWLATADEQAGIHIVDPFTGEHAALPDIRTVSFIRCWLSSGVHFFVDTEPLQKIRYGGQITRYAAMLILDNDFGVPAFATWEDPAAWTVAPARDGVEDAIHHEGWFYSVSSSGAIDAWEHKSGEFTSKVVAPARAMPVVKGFHVGRKYLVAMPDERLAVVLKYIRDEPPRIYQQPKSWACRFKVQVLIDAAHCAWQ